MRGSGNRFFYIDFPVIIKRIGYIYHYPGNFVNCSFLISCPFADSRPSQSPGNNKTFVAVNRSPDAHSILRVLREVQIPHQLVLNDEAKRRGGL